jgi:hypothetical protein
MGAAAAPLLAESVMAESFAVAAPSMFTVTELAPLAAPTFGGLSALGAEFGTAGLLAEAGTNASILSALGSGAGAAVPTLAEGIASGVTAGGLGAGEVGINQALVNAEQMQAVNSGIQEVAKDVVPKYMEDTVPKLLQNSVAGGYGSEEAVREAMVRAAETAKDIAPEALKSGYELYSKAVPEIIPEALNVPNPAYDLAQSASNGLRAGTGEGIKTALTELPQTTNPLAKGFNTAMDFAKNNPFSAASMAYSAKNLLGKKQEDDSGPTPYNGILSRYKMSPNFQGRQANPADFQYATKTYADGGIASFRSGGRSNKSDSLDPTGGSKIAGDYYESMLREQAQNMPSMHSDPGIIYDTDPDTRSLDPVTAAQIRMAKINKRSNIQAQNMKRPTPMGQINLAPPGAKAQESDTTSAAHGGIMHSSLGGYAAGGNPRLLKGPGDGMSDNIPATIAGKQPARLADGEFVVPADVVSHLGNGSTEAGAKILHEMMNKVRQARTGNSKQGKQINPRKFVPA